MEDDIPGDPKALDFGTIQKPVDTLYQATANLLDRSPPESLRNHVAAAVLLESIVRANYNAYRSILFLCADGPEGGRRPEYALSAGPLNRTILDSLFTIVFAFQNLAARSKWYFQAGWRDKKEEHDRIFGRYKDDPDWSDWLNEHGMVLAKARNTWGIPPSKAENPREIQWWPNPGRMMRNVETSEERRAFMQFLDAWYYKNLSAQSHLTCSGLVMRAGVLLPHQDTDNQDQVLNKQRSDNVAIAVILSIALLSEIEIELNLGLSERLRYVWGILIQYMGYAREMYTLRYAHALSAGQE
jgi:hypothetical protein